MHIALLQMSDSVSSQDLSHLYTYRVIRLEASGLILLILTKSPAQQVGVQVRPDLLDHFAGVVKGTDPTVLYSARPSQYI